MHTVRVLYVVTKPPPVTGSSSVSAPHPVSASKSGVWVAPLPLSLSHTHSHIYVWVLALVLVLILVFLIARLVPRAPYAPYSLSPYARSPSISCLLVSTVRV